MKRLDTNGGQPRTICDVVGDIPRGGTWGSGGDIVFAAGPSPRLFRVSSEGGVPVPLAPATDGGVAIEALWPHFLPDGRTFLYWARTASEGPGVYAGSIAQGSPPKRVLASGSNAAYDPSGYLLFSRGGVLLRQRFDAERLEVRGDATHVTEGLAWIEAQGRSFFSVSNTGVLVFQPGLSRSTQFAWFDRTGRMLETIDQPGSYGQPALSPNGKRLVYVDFRDGNLWMLDIGRNIVSRFTSGPGLKFSPSGLLTERRSSIGRRRRTAS